MQFVSVPQTILVKNTTYYVLLMIRHYNVPKVLLYLSIISDVPRDAALVWIERMLTRGLSAVPPSVFKSDCFCPPIIIMLSD
jgi:hypothetical protein